MKRRPVILIPGSTQRRGAEFSDVSISLSQCYVEALLIAGGLPWVLPASVTDPDAVRECVQRCDGIMLTGGDDVQPQLYARTLPPSLLRTVSQPDKARDLTELVVIESAFQQKKPLLAICRGQQILNVALGGSLLADIATQVPRALNHQCSDRKDQLVHEIDLTPDSLLARVMGQTKLRVNSSHHQAVARVARPFRVSATSADGVIEGLELESSAASLIPCLLAVQFHPERLWNRYPHFLEIFCRFVQTCATDRKRHI